MPQCFLDFLVKVFDLLTAVDTVAGIVTEIVAIVGVAHCAEIAT